MEHIRGRILAHFATDWRPLTRRKQRFQEYLRQLRKYSGPRCTVLVLNELQGDLLPC